MQKTLTLVLAIALCFGHTTAQTPNKFVRDAFIITRMVEKYHVQPQPFNDALSASFFSHLLNYLDEDKSLFTQEDIDKLSAYKYKLDDEVKGKQGAFLQLLTTTYKQRLQQTDTMAENICKTAFNFSLKEKLAVAEDTSYAANITALRLKLYKQLKFSVLEGIIDFAALAGNANAPSQKMIDSLEPGLRKRAGSTFRRSIKRMLQSKQGVENIIGTIYVHSLASSFDPHTAYMTADLKDNFETSLGKKRMNFGLALGEDEDGNVQIGGLQPGSSAFQCGQLNEGDKIISMQWDKREPIDVSGASLAEIDAMLASAGSSKVILNVKKADGTFRQATLQKAEVTTAVDDDRVKGFILNGPKKLGYISLPAFYKDWEDNNGVNGCANDVAKEIIKLKKENIEGLVLDLRYNGGGSMEEGIDLAGLFIDAGPVAQIQSRSAKITTLKDVNRGMVYDGPLMLLVNGFSASASEMVAATLQDYNRAIVLGSPTYGKATAQVILPMDTTIDVETYNGNRESESYIKITVHKFYRLNGSSSQLSGVQPQVLVPDAGDALQEREADQPNALKAANIEANKYYKPMASLNVAGTQDVAKKEMEELPYFKQLVKHISTVKANNQKRDVSLNMQEAWLAEKTAGNTWEMTFAGGSVKAPVFTVATHAYEQQRLNANSDLKVLSEEWKSNIQNDPYVQIAYRVLGSVIK
jgi:carboxyl-terminal processing protease